MSPSADSGTSEPSKGIWKDTALGSHFDTFYSDRYLTTLHLKRLHDVLAGIPYEHIIILVNTEHYGGGGIYNSYNLSYTRGRHFKPVVVHEFGHSFGGLGDEYDYGNDAPTYFADTEVLAVVESCDAEGNAVLTQRNKFYTGEQVGETAAARQGGTRRRRRIYETRCVACLRQLPHAHQRGAGVLPCLSRGPHEVD